MSEQPVFSKGLKSGNSLSIMSDALGLNGCLVRFFKTSTRSNLAIRCT